MTDLTPEQMLQRFRKASPDSDKIKIVHIGEDPSTDESSIEQLNRMMREDEAGQKGDIAKARNLLKIPEILKGADELIDLYLEELDGKIVYCRLTYMEMVELSKIKDTHERNLQEIYMRLNKADQTTTIDTVKSLPGGWLTLILMKINERENRFLLPALRRATTTLKEIPKP